MTSRARLGRDLPPTFTERHPVLVAAALVLVLVLLGVAMGRGIGTLGAQVFTALLDHVAQAG